MFVLHENQVNTHQCRSHIINGIPESYEYLCAFTSCQIYICCFFPCVCYNKFTTKFIYSSYIQCININIHMYIHKRTVWSGVLWYPSYAMHINLFCIDFVSSIFVIIIIMRIVAMCCAVYCVYDSRMDGNNFQFPHYCMVHYTLSYKMRSITCNNSNGCK